MPRKRNGRAHLPSAQIPFPFSWQILWKLQSHRSWRQLLCLPRTPEETVIFFLCISLTFGKYLGDDVEGATRPCGDAMSDRYKVCHQTVPIALPPTHKTPLYMRFSSHCRPRFQVYPRNVVTRLMMTPMPLVSSLVWGAFVCAILQLIVSQCNTASLEAKNGVYVSSSLVSLWRTGGGGVSCMWGVWPGITLSHNSITRLRDSCHATWQQGALSLYVDEAYLFCISRRTFIFLCFSSRDLANNRLRTLPDDVFLRNAALQTL